MWSVLCCKCVVLIRWAGRAPDVAMSSWPLPYHVLNQYTGCDCHGTILPTDSATHPSHDLPCPNIVNIQVVVLRIHNILESIMNTQETDASTGLDSSHDAGPANLRPGCQAGGAPRRTEPRGPTVACNEPDHNDATAEALTAWGLGRAAFRRKSFMSALLLLFLAGIWHIPLASGLIPIGLERNLFFMNLCCKPSFAIHLWPLNISDFRHDCANSSFTKRETHAAEISG